MRTHRAITGSLADRLRRESGSIFARTALKGGWRPLVPDLNLSARLTRRLR